MNVRPFRSRYVLAFFLVAVLVLSAYQLGASSLSPDTLEWGSFAKGYSAIVLRDRSTYYSFNGTTGAKIESGTNASQIINNAINSLGLTTGGTILLKSGIYNIDTTIDPCKHHLKIRGEQQGSTILNWIGSAGGGLFATNTLQPVYDLTIENLELRCNNKANAIHIKSALRFTIQDILILGGDSSNPYHGIILEAISGSGNVGWGKIDNVFMDYVHYAISFNGYDSSNIVTVCHIGTVFADHVLGYGLRFAQWCDTIDVDYAWLVSGADNTAGTIFNDGANPNEDNAVYNIHINRIIWDNWLYSGTRTVKLNYCKEIVIDSAFKGNLTDTFGDFSGYAYSYYIVQQGYVGNTIQIWEHRMGKDAGVTSSIGNGTWVAHYVGYEPTSIILTPATNVAVWVIAKNSTHFQVGIASGSVVIYYYAEYQP